MIYIAPGTPVHEVIALMWWMIWPYLLALLIVLVVRECAVRYFKRWDKEET